MKNMNLKSPHQNLCKSPTIQMTISVFLFFKLIWSTFEKIHVLCIFSKVDQKSMSTKKLKLPSKSLDKFASCHAAVFKLHKISLFCY